MSLLIKKNHQPSVASGRLLAKIDWFVMVTVERRLHCQCGGERRRCNLKPKYDSAASPEPPPLPSFLSPLDRFPFSSPFPYPVSYHVRTPSAPHLPSAGSCGLRTPILCRPASSHHHCSFKKRKNGCSGADLGGVTRATDLGRRRGRGSGTGEIRGGGGRE